MSSVSILFTSQILNNLYKTVVRERGEYLRPASHGNIPIQKLPLIKWAS